MKLRLSIAAATCLALPLAAHAQPVTGPYVSLEGGTSILNPTNYNYENYPAGGEVAGPAIANNISFNGGQNGKFLFKPSYAGEVSLGYGFGNGFRVELEGNLYRNTVAKDNNADNNGGEQYVAHGAQFTYGPMFNVLYDFNVGLPVYPYVGAGAGYQWAKFSPHIDDTNSFGDTVEGTKGSFAYQIIAGLAYPLPMVPGLSLTVDYRFMQLTASRNYASTYVYNDPSPTPDGKVKLGQQSSHTFMAGLRYQIFNPPPVAPAPAPAPMAAAPAPAPAKTYLVFFDWDKSILTPRATQIIAEAASDSKTTAVTTINVSGYTDTSGTPVYNQGLSERRAKAVAAQLVTDGVPASAIETHAYGETHLLVPTGPGVREPQNRRVEIVLD
jgi:outer membrane protein OmpA-like peptidoglycan-associated protein